MSADTILINTARAALIDEIALVKLLREGRIAAAGLDVFSDEPLPDNSPLLNCPNLILTPHMGGVGVEAMNRTSREVALKIIEGLGIASP
jgi:phosphoglycerate dehydrogenase-like enzyme